MERYISAHTFRVRNPLGDSDKGLYFPLDKVGQHDMLDLISKSIEQEFLNKFEHTDNVSFKVDKSSIVKNQRKRIIYGYAHYGRYGTQSDLLEISSDKVVHKKKSKQADVMKYLFYFYAPKGLSHGIFLTEKVGTYGIYSRINPAVKQYVRDKVQGASVSFLLQRSNKVIQDVTQLRKTKKLQIEKTALPENYMKAIKSKGFLPEQSSEDYEVSVVITPKKRGGFLSFSEKVFESDSMLSQHDDDFEGELKLEAPSSKGKQPRMVSVSNPYAFEMNYNITDEVEMVDGQPDLKSLISYCENLSIELSEDINRL